MSISKTRQKLVLVARELFARKGLDNTTMNDIAQASEKGRRTLYTYFRNKEDIYFAVIEGELEHLSERLDEVANMNVEPEQKLLTLIYSHLSAIKEAVARNGSLRAEFFRNIWMVEKVRKTFDLEEKKIITRILNEGMSIGRFQVENVNLMTEILHYTVKGLEVPYIYNRIGEGLTEDSSKPIVRNILCRMIGMDMNRTLNQ